MRSISAMITRRCLAFSGSSRPSSFSTASDQPRFMFMRGQVVHPVGVGNPLPRREVLADLLRAAVQIADVRRDLGDDFAVGPQHQPQHAVRAGMLRSHVDQHFVRADVEFDDAGIVQIGGHELCFQCRLRR